MHFWLCQGLNGQFGLLGPKNNRPSSQTATCRKTEGVQSYVSMFGRYTPIELGLYEPRKWGLYGCSVKKADFLAENAVFWPEINFLEASSKFFDAVMAGRQKDNFFVLNASQKLNFCEEYTPLRLR